MRRAEAMTAFFTQVQAKQYGVIYDAAAPEFRPISRDAASAAGSREEPVRWRAGHDSKGVA